MRGQLPADKFSTDHLHKMRRYNLSPPLPPPPVPVTPWAPEKEIQVHHLQRTQKKGHLWFTNK